MKNTKKKRSLTHSVSRSPLFRRSLKASLVKNARKIFDDTDRLIAENADNYMIKLEEKWQFICKVEYDWPSCSDHKTLFLGFFKPLLSRQKEGTPLKYKGFIWRITFSFKSKF